MAVRLFALQLSVRPPGVRGPHVGRLPSRGDVVVFRHPTEDADLIKRVIGIPGDTVEVRRRQLILNGRLVPRRPLPPAKVAGDRQQPVPDRAARSADSHRGIGRPPPAFTAPIWRPFHGGPSYTVLDQVDHGPADDFAPVRVPGGHVFVMGDNRDDSLDSRYPAYEGGIGMLPVENLIGRASLTFWSTDGRASWFKPWTWFSALRVGRVGNGYTGDAE